MTCVIVYNFNCYHLLPQILYTLDVLRIFVKLTHFTTYYEFYDFVLINQKVFNASRINSVHYFDGQYGGPYSIIF